MFTDLAVYPYKTCDTHFHSYLFALTCMCAPSAYVIATILAAQALKALIVHSCREDTLLPHYLVITHQAPPCSALLSNPVLLAITRDSHTTHLRKMWDAQHLLCT